MRGAAENAAGCAADNVHIITNISTVVTRDSIVKNYTMQSSAQCIQVWQSPTPSEGPQLTCMVIGSPELATTKGYEYNGTSYYNPHHQAVLQASISAFRDGAKNASAALLPLTAPMG